MKRGYIGQIANKEKVYKNLLQHGTDSFHTEIVDLFESLKSGDELVIDDITELDMSMTELIKQAEPLRNKQITIQLIDKLRIDLDTYLDVLDSANKMEQEWLTLRTKEGIKKAKENGKIGGRPKISEEKIEEIKYWHNQQLDFRSISKKTGLSLGTVHKYVNYLKEVH